MSAAKKLPVEVARSRDQEFENLYGFIVAAASVVAVSGDPEKAIVGVRLHAFLTDNREAVKKRVMKP